MEDVVRLDGGDGAGFCTGCFSGDYPTAVPTEIRKNRFEQKISESEGKA
jgi:amidophosphoribosyltransferase